MRVKSLGISRVQRLKGHGRIEIPRHVAVILRVNAAEIVLIANFQRLTERAVKAMGKCSTIRPPGLDKASKAWQEMLWQPFIGCDFPGKGVAQLQCFLEIRVLLSYFFCLVGVEYHLKGMP